MKFFSRSGLDQLLFENFFRGKRGGVFVDAGATADETANNSLFFERFMDWRGLRVEPSASVAPVLEKHSLLQVDYCSIHAPGRECALLSEIDFARYNISLISLRTRDADGKLTQFLTGRGYELFATLENELRLQTSRLQTTGAHQCDLRGLAWRCQSPPTARRSCREPVQADGSDRAHLYL